MRHSHRLRWGVFWRLGRIAATIVILGAVFVFVLWRRRRCRRSSARFLPERLRAPGRIAWAWPVVFVEAFGLGQFFLVGIEHQVGPIRACLKCAQRNGVQFVSAEGALADAQNTIGDLLTRQINDHVINFSELLALLVFDRHAHQLAGLVDLHHLATARSADRGGVGAFVRWLVGACRGIFILGGKPSDRNDRESRGQNGCVDS